MLKISWIAKASNQEILRDAGTTKSSIIRKRKRRAPTSGILLSREGPEHRMTNFRGGGG